MPGASPPRARWRRSAAAPVTGRSRKYFSQFRPRGRTRERAGRRRDRDPARASLRAVRAYGAACGGIDAGGLAAGLVALWAVPVGAGVAIALALLAIAPASRARESLSVLVTVAFVAGWLVNAFWIPRLLGVDTRGPL